MVSLAPFLLAANPRQRVIGDLLDIVGRQNARALWLPDGSEALVQQDEAVPSRLWTHATSPRGRLTRVGKAWVLSFNGTSDYLSAPDATDLSFGNGASDNAFSIICAANVTDTAATRAFLRKSGEFNLSIINTDFLRTQLVDLSVPAVPDRISDVVGTQARWAVQGCTYDPGIGSGATAANGITIYENGAVRASTATNAATYVAMENTANGLLIGSTDGTDNFFSGLMACVLLCAGALSLAQNRQAYEALNRYLQGVA